MATVVVGESISRSDSTAAPATQTVNTCESNATDLVLELDVPPPPSSATMDDEQRLMHSSSSSTDPAAEEADRSPPPPLWQQRERKLTILPLIFLIFYEVSGGPFGIEDVVGAGGPFLALIGFILFPFIWSLPEALITAELGTMFPEDGGYVVWVTSALGPYWGFQVGWVKWLSGVIDNTVYPFLFLDYLQSGIPALAHGYPKVVTPLALTLVLTFVNFRGLTIVGWAAVVIGSFHLLPFLAMMIISIPLIRPRRWLVAKDLRRVNWKLYLNTLFWNLNFWDSISTLVGEVRDPKKSLPKALFFALVLVVCSYFFPVLCSAGAVGFKGVVEWKEGSFSTVAKIIGGLWLSWWIQCASAVSNMGMFLSEMSTDSFQLLGMAERGMLPAFLAKRSRYGTPLIAILLSSSGILLHSWLTSLRDVVEVQNFLYCVGMILEFVAFIRLRMRYPDASRPYKIPGGTAVAVLICIPPTVFICVVLALSTRNLKVFVPGLAAVIAGLILRPCLKFVERKKWVKFSTNSHLPILPGQFQNNIISPI